MLVIYLFCQIWPKKFFFLHWSIFHFISSLAKKKCCSVVFWVGSAVTLGKFDSLVYFRIGCHQLMLTFENVKWYLISCLFTSGPLGHLTWNLRPKLEHPQNFMKLAYVCLFWTFLCRKTCKILNNWNKLFLKSFDFWGCSNLRSHVPS